MPRTHPSAYALAGIRCALALACVAAFWPSLPGEDFIHDDQWIVADNPLLRAGFKHAPALLTTGYWEAARGLAAPVQEYRPLLMLSFLIQRSWTGPRLPPIRAANLLLHAAVALLVFEALRRRIHNLAAAAAGALFYAVMPVHVEAVLAATGRSELLSALFVLGAWLTLDGGSGAGRTAAGLGLYLAGMLTKEHALLMPGLLALSDWTFHGEPPWSASRRRRTLTLAAGAVAYLFLRAAVLPRAFHAGASYFRETGALSAALTLSRFIWGGYVWPSLSGSGLCTDFSRPLIPDSGPSDVVAWLALASLAAAVMAGGWGLARRRPWAFWLLGPGLFLVPTLHVVPIDAIGGQRFLYLPTVGLAGLLAHALAAGGRLRLRGLAFAAALSLWQLASARSRSREWLGGYEYYQAAARCNPLSAKARSSLGALLIARGATEEGRGRLMEAIGLNPKLSDPYYNLARLAYDRGDYVSARRWSDEALRLAPGLPDYWVLRALILEAQGRWDHSGAALRRALVLRPWDPLAHYNLGRHYLRWGQPDAAVEHWTRFLELAPDDPDAPRLAELVLRLREKP